MIDLITGHQGMPHISAKQISDLNNAMMEGYGADKIMRMKDGTITLTNNDVFTVNPGYWRVNGYDMEIQQTETIQIERPTGNLKRYDDIYIEILRDIPSGAERAEIVKVEGSPASSNPSHPPVPTEPELTTDVLLLCIQVGYVYATSTYTTKHDDTIPYHYVSETEYTELLTHLLQEQYARARMSSGNFAPIRVDDIIKLNTKGTWTHTDPAHPGAYSYDTYTLYSGNIVFQISSNELGLKSILVTTSSTSGYSEKLILFKGEVGIGTDNLWLPRNGSQVPSGLSAAAIVNGEEYSVGTGGYYVELPSGVLTELYIQATSGISGNTSFYPTIRYEDDPTYTRSYPPAPTNIMLWNQIEGLDDEVTDYINLSGCKNHLPYPYRHTTRVTVGVTYTDNGDGSVTLSTGSGGATADAAFEINNLWSYAGGINLDGIEYLLNGFPEGSSESTYYIQALYKDSANNDQYMTYTENDSLIKAQGNKNHVGFRIIVKSGTVLTTPVTFKPMLRLSSDKDGTFEPYAMTNRKLTEKVLTHETYYVKDGTVTSVANNTSTDLESTKITLPTGTYLFLATAEFRATNDVGTRKLLLKIAEATFGLEEVGGNLSGYTLLSGMSLQTLTATRDAYVRVLQSSGSAMNVVGFLRAIRII